MGDKVLIPGVVGLTNYRQHLVRPVYGTIPYGTRAGTQSARMRRTRTGLWRPYNPAPYIPINQDIANRVSSYVGTNTQTRHKRKKQYKKPCCVWVKGKKICKPKFCPKKRKIYRKRFYW